MRLAPTCLALLLAGCHASALRGPPAAGGPTPYARDALLAARETASPADDGLARRRDDETLRQAREDLERVARAARADAEAPGGEARRLGFAAELGVGEEALRQPLTSAVVLGAALERSPAIAAARASYRATVEQFDQIGFLDDLLRQYTTFAKDLDLRFGAERQKELVETHFPFPGTLALESRIVASEARAARERLDQTVRATLAAAGKAYHEYLYAGEAVRIIDSHIDLLRMGMVQIAESRYGLGAAKQGLVLKIHTEAASLEDQRITLQDAERTARARLASILGLDAGFPLGEPTVVAAVAPPAASEALYQRALQARQELRAFDARIERAEALIELAETKAYPDLSLGYSRFQEGAGTRVGGARMRPPFAEKPAAMPKFWYGETASFVQEMQRRLEATRAERADLAARISFQVKDAHFHWDAAWRQAELASTSLLPQAEQSYQILESGWQEGVVEFLDALDAQRAWLRYRLQERAAVRDTHVSRFALLDALGTAISEEEGEAR
jgi:outer membrane protein TolC